ncbi:YihY/virulence factor BrkB family protein [Falsiroseomonas sp. HW251]|uniref:YihY/virulence factor BrkB family protein n=1 Tax=Falsiroseomonas sp. HW251 TaxID=3390998 RepID=UPI003D31C921
MLDEIRRHLAQAYAVATSDRISLVAAGCAFYAMLALFPAISLLVALYGLFFDPVTVESQLDLMEGVVPEAGQELIAERVHELVAAPRARLEWTAIVAGLIAFWSASAGIRAMLGALNLAQGEQEGRGVLAFYATAMLLTLGAIVAVVVGLAFLVALPRGLEWLGMPPATALALRGLGLVLVLLAVLVSVGVLYRFGPARPPPGWRLVSPGSVAATMLWAVASVLFSLYVSNVATYDALYGSLGAAVALLMWFWVSVYVILLGAELDAAIRRERGR